MLRFAQSDESTVLILTLTELCVTTNPDFYFVFTHNNTRQEVTFTDQDESSYPERYNKFTIDPSILFADKEPGEWHYKIYENDANGVLLEYGKLIIERATEFEFTKYDQATTFKVYNG